MGRLNLKLMGASGTLWDILKIIVSILADPTTMTNSTHIRLKSTFQYSSGNLNSKLVINTNASILIKI